MYKPNNVVAAILAICLTLVIAVFYLGYTTGQTYCMAITPAGS